MIWIAECETCTDGYSSRSLAIVEDWADEHEHDYENHRVNVFGEE